MRRIITRLDSVSVPGRKASTPAGRSGLGAFDLIVVISIFALLSALVLPAIEESREDARLLQCKHNLRQLGVALANYHSTNGSMFPPGYVSGNTSGGLAGWGWMMMLLPQFDEAPLYNQFSDTATLPNFSIGFSTLCSSPHLNPQEGNIETHIPAFRCPSDVGRPNANIFFANTGRNNYFHPAGRSNYVGVCGTDPNWTPENGLFYLSSEGLFAGDAVGQIGKIARTVDERESLREVGAGEMYCPTTVFASEFGGTFGADSKIGYREMTDGSSNCIVSGERYSPVGSEEMGVVVGDAIWCGVTDTKSVFQSLVLGEASLPINFNFTTSNLRPWSTGFGSMHLNGANFLMGDGTVRFINQNVDMGTFRLLSRINDGSSLGEF